MIDLPHTKTLPCLRRVASSLLTVVAAGGLFLGCQEQRASSLPEPPHVMANTPVEAGRYLVTVAGCNDCHTENYLQTEGDVAEEDWLTGSRLGWRGPWGTTYPQNLRLRVTEMTEDEFVTMLHTRTALPPMPWMNVNQMSDTDARAIYRYVKSLGVKGERVPQALPPDQEPATPYLSLMPLNLPQP